jgi:hypothetical protein
MGTVAAHTAAAWGDAHDAFKAAAKDISSSTAPLLVVGVPISNSKDYPVNAVLSVSSTIEAFLG